MMNLTLQSMFIFILFDKHIYNKSMATDYKVLYQ